MFLSCIFLIYLSFASTSARSSDSEKDLAKIKLFYCLSSSESIDAPEAVNLPHFNARKPLKIIIHGWNANRQAMAPLQRAYFTLNRHNILTADWESISSKPYSTARELTRAMGYRIGSLLSVFMSGVNITVEQVHVIGHSLGAHIAGNVGKYFNGRLSRITALDPAGPLFVPLSTDAIDKSDALFVDAIHSDIVLGEAVPRSHADFYPNRGATSQPGCEALDVITLHACSHYQAPAFFTESILQPDTFLAYECSLHTILSSPSDCMRLARKFSQRNTIIMGEYVDHSSRGTYYVKTSRFIPYGIGIGGIYHKKQSLNHG